MKLLLIVLFSVVTMCSYAQKKKIFIYRVRSANGSAIKYHLKINGLPVDFKNDTQQEFIITSDSIRIEVLNKTFIHKTTFITQKAEEINYFIVYPAIVKTGLKGTDIIVQNVCKECYYERLSHSKKIPASKKID